MITLTLVLPAHNEGQSIRETLLEIDSVDLEGVNLTIYVSEDGSLDNTRSEVQVASGITSKTKIILAPPAERLGYSKAVLRGILNCNTELIGFMDADGQFDPNDITNLVNKIEKETIVIGFRNPRRDSRIRILYSKAFGLAYRFFGGPKRIDPSSPFIICNTKDIKFLGEINPHLKFGFWWEFQTRIHRTGIKIIEVPVAHRVRTSGNTQVYSLAKMPKIVISHLVGLYRLRQELVRSK